MHHFSRRGLDQRRSFFSLNTAADGCRAKVGDHVVVRTDDASCTCVLGDGFPTRFLLDDTLDLGCSGASPSSAVGDMVNCFCFCSSTSCDSNR